MVSEYGALYNRLERRGQWVLPSPRIFNPMLNALSRKARQVIKDPVLRQWLIGRALGRYQGEPVFTPHRPPYLEGLLPLKQQLPNPPTSFSELGIDKPRSAITLPLPGLDVTLNPGDEDRLFEQSFQDTETLLAVHRFAWIPLLGRDLDPAWVNSLWQAWQTTYRQPNDAWPWHPYTAAERAINILDFAGRHGLPGSANDTLKLLAAHGPAIAEQLEYFGDHHTSNHMANNGRGLFKLGLALGIDSYADMGAKILLNEAERIFLPSGILREGSSHYHLLLTRNYADAWLVAERFNRAEALALKTITKKAMSVIPNLFLSGGMPLVGDISPDCPPGFLSCLFNDNDGWFDLLDEDDAALIKSLRGSAEEGTVREDGWLKAEFGPWSGLWHASPEGWSHMPGHGHQDCGSFELHFGEEPIFVDPGRGAYGLTGEAQYFQSEAAHNGIVIDGCEPFPANKPYYCGLFRGKYAKNAPKLEKAENNVALTYGGYSRLRSVDSVTRQWAFSESAVEIEDQISGSNSHDIVQRLYTPLAISLNDDSVTLTGKESAFRLTSQTGSIKAMPTKIWKAYGQSLPGTVIQITSRSNLPWTSALKLEVA